MTTHSFSAVGPVTNTNGYHAFPIVPASKKTHWRNWQRWCDQPPSPEQIDLWCAKYPEWSVAIACGKVIVVDIDELDEAKAVALERLALDCLGPTPLRRVGLPPKCALFYRADGEVRKSKVGPIDVLGRGSYVLAFGLHPITKRPYAWSEQTPATMRLTDLPAVTQAQIDAFKRAVEPAKVDTTPYSSEELAAAAGTGPLSGERIAPIRAGGYSINLVGKVMDGRDGYLARLVWEEACRGRQGASSVASAAWKRFEQTADLVRPARDSKKQWSYAHALKKAKALAATGKVKSRKPEIDGAGEHGFWTLPTKNAFAAIVTESTAYRLLSPAAMRVSNTMLGLVYGQGTCFASVERLARELGLHIDTVKKGRQELRRLGFWRAWQDKGGKGLLAHYQPCPAVLTRPSPESAFAEKAAEQTVAARPSTINQGEEEIDWSDLIEKPKVFESALAFPVSSLESVADVPRQRPSSTGNDVGSVPGDPSEDKFGPRIDRS